MKWTINTFKIKSKSITKFKIIASKFLIKLYYFLLFSELALYALDVYYMQTYSGGSGGSGYNRIDRNDKQQYQEKNQNKLLMHLLLKIVKFTKG